METFPRRAGEQIPHPRMGFIPASHSSLLSAGRTLTVPVTEKDLDSGNGALENCSSHTVFEHCGLSSALKIYHCADSPGF